MQNFDLVKSGGAACHDMIVTPAHTASARRSVTCLIQRCAHDQHQMACCTDTQIDVKMMKDEALTGSRLGSSAVGKSTPLQGLQPSIAS